MLKKVVHTETSLLQRLKYSFELNLCLFRLEALIVNLEQVHSPIAEILKRLYSSNVNFGLILFVNC
jgi:hypothetical protein